MSIVFFFQFNFKALIAGLPKCAVKPLQMIQSAAAQLVFSEPKRAHITLSLCIGYRHWLMLLRSYESTSLPEAFGWWVSNPHGTITERHKTTFQNILIHCSLLEEWSSYFYSNSRIPDNIQETAENSSLLWALNYILLTLLLHWAGFRHIFISIWLYSMYFNSILSFEFIVCHHKHESNIDILPHFLSKFGLLLSHSCELYDFYCNQTQTTSYK